MSFVGASAGVSCSDCIADTLPGIASTDSMAVTVNVTVTVKVTVNVTVTATATVTVTVNRLGALGPGCASCGLLYGCYEARRVEGWLSMLLRQGRLYCLPAGFST